MRGIYTSGKEFAYDHIDQKKTVPFKKGKDTRINLRVSSQRRSIKAILLLFVEPYMAGARDAEKYMNPDLTKVSVTVNGLPNKLYNNGLESMDIWEGAKRFFMKEKKQNTAHDAKKFYMVNKFCLLVDLHSMADYAMHGSGKGLVNAQDVVQLELEQNASRSRTVNCHVFVISDSQMNIMGQQLESVQY